MADTKISGLTAASTLDGTELYAADQSAASRKVTGAQIQTMVLRGGTASAASWPIIGNGTVLTSPAAGALEYDSAAFYLTPDGTSGRATVDTNYIFRLTADGTTRGGTIADFFADGGNNALPTSTNGIYVIDYYVWFTKTTAGTVTWTLTNTQAYTNAVAWWRNGPVAGQQASGTSVAAGIDNSTTAALALPATASLTTATEQHAHIHLLAECGTAGNIRLRVTCSAGTVTPRRGSHYIARRLPAGNVGAFAA